MGNTEGKTLRKLLEDELGRIKVAQQYDDIAKILEDEKECQSVINKILHENAYDSSENPKTLGLSQERAKHILMTYLVGKGFSKFGGLAEKIQKELLLDGAEFDKIWMPTALYHDYGYYDDKVKNGKYDLKLFQPYLLEEKEIEDLQILKERVMAYTLEEIQAYERYARTYHAQKGKEKQDEMIDHGIFGGVKVYAKLKGKYGNTKRLKSICLTIAQHNIFRSGDSRTDEKYEEAGLQKLCSTSDFRIDEKTPLLLFLCLVDTLECAKKLGKKRNPGAYLEMRTILNHIKVSVTPDVLEVDCLELKKWIDKKNNNNDLKEAYGSYIKGIEGIGEWTAFECMNIGQDVFAIKMRQNESSKAA